MATVFKRKGQGPWIIQYFDHMGRRRERSTRTTDKRTADRLAGKIEADVALRRDGVIDPALDQKVQADATPLARHLADYLRHMRMGGRKEKSVADAERHVNWAIEATGASRLSQLTLDAMNKALERLHAGQRAARTINHHGGSVRTFLRWCVRTGRLGTNPLQHLPRLDADRDLKRVRRALTEDELARLFAEADERGRGLWYRAAYWAGLRRSDLERLTWAEVDLGRGTLVLRYSKAHRVDEVPIHPELAMAFRAAGPGLPGSRVFPTAVTNATRRKDFEKAKIPLVDGDGRHADLHSLRVTLHTRLVREAVPPQIAQRILRHADYATTLKHYTRLSLEDDASALAKLTAPKAAPSSSPSSQGTKPCDSVPDGSKAQAQAAG